MFQMMYGMVDFSRCFLGLLVFVNLQLKIHMCFLSIGSKGFRSTSIEISTLLEKVTQVLSYSLFISLLLLETFIGCLMC